MNPVSPHPLLGMLLHGVGAMFAATCYTPQKQVKRWSWQTYWITQAGFCWFLPPILGAMLTIPQLGTVLDEAPRSAMLRSFFARRGLWRCGGTAFGIAIRHIGFSLTYAIAVGLSIVLGTLAATLGKPGAGWIVAGITAGALGIAATGRAGRLKEMDLNAQALTGDFSIVKGLLLSLLAGALSAVYGLALEAGEPVADVASAHGAGMWRGNVVYIFANTGAFFTTAIYCLSLHLRHRTLGEVIELPAGPENARLAVNWAMAFVTGLFWYGQFFFYNLGHVRMGHYKFTSWAIHMIMLVLLSNAVGLVLKEWLNCRLRTRWTLRLALLVLIGAVLLLTYGNYIGDLATRSAPARD